MIGSTLDNNPVRLRPSKWQQLVEVLLIVLVLFAVGGDPPPSVNEPHYLCRLKHYWNPEWCAGDMFLESPDTQLVFIWLMGWLTKFVSLTATAWIGRLLAWTLLAWAWQQLSWRCIPRRFAAVLSAALWATLLNLAHLAGEWVVGGVEAKCFAYALVLLALDQLVSGRWNRVWLLMGAACAFHPLAGGWSTVVAAGIWLLTERRTAPLGSMLPGIAGGGLLALVGILPAVALTWNSPAEIVAQANVIYVFERLPHHLALLHLPEDEISLRLLRHGMLLVALWGLARWIQTVDRVNDASDDEPVDPRALGLMARFAWGGVLLALVGFAIEIVLWNDAELVARLLKYYWFRLTDVAAALAVALNATGVIAIGIERRRWWGPGLLLATLALAGSHIVSLSLARYAEPTPRADRKLIDSAAWANACDWVAKNTPISARFLTPRIASSFKWRTGRPEVVTFKDIPQDAPGIVEWNRRLRDIFYINKGGEPEALKSLGSLPAARLQQIVDEYNIDYILAEGDVRLPFPIVYPTDVSADDVYVIYQVNGRNTEPR